MRRITSALASELRRILRDLVERNGENIGLTLFLDEVRKTETAVIADIKEEIRRGTLRPGAFF